MTAIEATPAPGAGPQSAPVILSAEEVTRVYTRRSRVFGPRLEVRALSSVSLDVHRNETVGVVGESGSGKTTLTRLLLGLERPNAGSVRFQGKDLRVLDGDATRLYRRSVAAVFQNPYSSLDPRMHIGGIVTEQLALSRTGTRGERTNRASQLLEMVGLSPDMARRYPRQLSGGQRQRVAIARALACNPEVIILDEPISALDVSVRAQVINLLLDLQERLGLAYVFVAHDLAIVRHMCHRVVVLYRGEVVERGAASDVLAAPRHPYTLTLLEASYLKESAGHDSTAGAGLGGTSMRKLIEATPESGCPYRLRCALASARCERESPALGEIGPGHEVACHHPAAVSSAKVGA